eukprot:605161_1
MPLFGKTTKSAPAYDYAKQDIDPPQHIPKRNEHIHRPNIIVPSFIVSLSQHIVSFVLRKTSRLPLIGTKNGDIRTFEVDEFHIVLLSLLTLSIHYTRKYRKQSKQCSQQLDKLLIDSKIHNFETLAAVDHNNIKRIECLYYKNQFQIYDIDLLTRTELRTFIQQIMSQCEVLSGLSLKILETVNTMFKLQRMRRSLYEHRMRKGSIAAQHVLKTEKRTRESQIDEFYDCQEETLDKYQSFFDEKNNEQHLHETREIQRQLTEKEILNSYQNQKEHKQTQINAVKLDTNDDQKMTEEEDEQTVMEMDPLQRKRIACISNLNYDHEYLVQQAENVPIEQIDFSSKQISRHNLQKEVNQMKYDIILSEQDERRTEKIRKYAVITLIVATTTFSYWYHRYYEGRGVVQRIRDTQARFRSYF